MILMKLHLTTFLSIVLVNELTKIEASVNLSPFQARMLLELERNDSYQVKYTEIKPTLLGDMAEEEVSMGCLKNLLNTFFKETVNQTSLYLSAWMLVCFEYDWNKVKLDLEAFFQQFPHSVFHPGKEQQCLVAMKWISENFDAGSDTEVCKAYDFEREVLLEQKCDEQSDVESCVNEAVIEFLYMSSIENIEKFMGCLVTAITKDSLYESIQKMDDFSCTKTFKTEFANLLFGALEDDAEFKDRCVSLFVDIIHTEFNGNEFMTCISKIKMENPTKDFYGFIKDLGSDPKYSSYSDCIKRLYIMLTYIYILDERTACNVVSFMTEISKTGHSDVNACEYESDLHIDVPTGSGLPYFTSLKNYGYTMFKSGLSYHSQCMIQLLQKTFILSPYKYILPLLKNDIVDKVYAYFHPDLDIKKDSACFTHFLYPFLPVEDLRSELQVQCTVQNGLKLELNILSKSEEQVRESFGNSLGDFLYSDIMHYLQTEVGAANEVWKHPPHYLKMKRKRALDKKQYIFTHQTTSAMDDMLEKLKKNKPTEGSCYNNMQYLGVENELSLKNFIDGSLILAAFHTEQENDLYGISNEQYKEVFDRVKTAWERSSYCTKFSEDDLLQLNTILKPPTLDVSTHCSLVYEADLESGSFFEGKFVFSDSCTRLTQQAVLLEKVDMISQTFIYGSSEPWMICFVMKFFRTILYNTIVNHEFDQCNHTTYEEKTAKIRDWFTNNYELSSPEFSLLLEVLDYNFDWDTNYAARKFDLLEPIRLLIEQIIRYSVYSDLSDTYDFGVASCYRKIFAWSRYLEIPQFPNPKEDLSNPFSLSVIKTDD